jgi:cyclic pyranopterin phosphate synthase
MNEDAVFAFEGVDGDLPIVPLAARRVLDVLGRKLSLEGWRSLPIESRWAIVQAGASAAVDPRVMRTLDVATPPPEPIAPVADPPASSPPRELRDALGASRPLDDDSWAELGALGRYALAKSAARPEKLAIAYEEIVASPLAFAAGRSRLTHVMASGAAHMVDIGDKPVTERRATASARVIATGEALAAIGAGRTAKGDVIAAARIAGILAAKRTPELIPLCHPVVTTHAAVEFEVDVAKGALRVEATVEARDRTGVEMEALVAASVAALTVYDMIKSVDRWARIEVVQLESKSGGKSGEVWRPTGARRP